MKKLILILSACMLMALCAFVAFAEGKEMPYGKCRKCGGDLSWTACAKRVSITCVSCKGTGKLSQGKYQVTCSACKGTGKMYEWKSGNVCKNCNSVYLD